MHATPTRTPSFEALDHATVERRIREEMPDVTDDERRHLSRAVMALVPPPAELGEYLRKAVADLEGIWEFVHWNAAASAKIEASLSDLSSELFNLIGYLQRLRDRFQRRCEHEEIVPTENGGKYCPGCGSGWGPGQLDNIKPGLVLTSRAFLPTERKERERKTGRAFFVYFITELLRELGRERTAALRVAGKLIAMFWNDGKPPYSDDIQLDDAHGDGKRAGQKRGLATVEDFMNTGLLLHNYSELLIWVPVKRTAGTPP